MPMQFRRPAATVVAVLMLLIYAGALRPLDSHTATEGGPAWAQGYPEPSATQRAYPPPAIATATRERHTPSPSPASPTATRRPTNGPPRMSPTTPPRKTPSIVMGNATPTRQPIASPRPTATTSQATPVATPTSGIVILLPATATEPADAVTSMPLEQTVGPPSTRPGVSTAVARVEPPVVPAPELDFPVEGQLPPVVDQGREVGVGLTLLAGVIMAGLAWWVWKHWLTTQ